MDELRKRLEIEQRFNSIMKEMKISRNICHYDYLKVAVLMIYENPSLGEDLKNELYPCIAITLGIKQVLVGERVRGIKDVVLRKGDKQALKHYLHYDRNSRKMKTSQFLYMLANAIKTK